MAANCIELGSWRLQKLELTMCESQPAYCFLLQKQREPAKHGMGGSYEWVIGTREFFSKIQQQIYSILDESPRVILSFDSKKSSTYMQAHLRLRWDHLLITGGWKKRKQAEPEWIIHFSFLHNGTKHFTEGNQYKNKIPNYCVSRNMYFLSLSNATFWVSSAWINICFIQINFSC